MIFNFTLTYKRLPDGFVILTKLFSSCFRSTEDSENFLTLLTLVTLVITTYDQFLKECSLKVQFKALKYPVPTSSIVQNCTKIRQKHIKKGLIPFACLLQASIQEVLLLGLFAGAI